MRRPVSNIYRYQDGAGAPPEGDWRYVQCSTSVRFGPGWWPYHRAGAPCPVIALPSSLRRSLVTETVEVLAHGETGALGLLALFHRPRAKGGLVAACELTIDLQAEAVTVNTECPQEVREQGELKGARLLAMLLGALRERDTGWTRPWSIEDEKLRSIARELAQETPAPGGPFSELAATGAITAGLRQALEDRRRTMSRWEGGPLALLAAAVRRAERDGDQFHPGWATA